MSIPSPSTRYRLFRISPTWLPYCIGVLALSGTIIATIYTAENSEQKSKDRFDDAMLATQQAINDRVKVYSVMLRGAAGLFAANPAVSLQQFHAYAESLNLPVNYPGTLGIGFSKKVKPSEIKALVENMKRQGIDDFKVWPMAPRDEYHSVIYREPLTELNRRAVGYDMTVEPARRQAMERARDTGLPTASGKISLVQEKDQAQKHPGVLIFFPVYNPSAVLNTVEQRRASLLGFIYCPIRIKDFLNYILETQSHQLVNFEIYDGDQASPENLLYSTNEPTDFISHSRFRGDKKLEVGGHAWTIYFSSTTEIDGSLDYSLPTYVFLAGFSFSLLLFALTLLQVKARLSSELASHSLKKSRQELENQAQILTQEIKERKKTEKILAAQKYALELVAQGKALPIVLNNLVQIIEQFNAGQYVSILLLDKDGLRLRHAAAVNLPETYCRAIDGAKIGPRAGSFGASAYTKETVIVSNIANDPLWEKYQDIALDHQLRACWATPIISTQGNVLGVFTIYYSTPHTPTADELDLVSVLAHTAAIPIERKIGEGALQESEERLRLALSAAEMGTWRVDLKTNLDTRDSMLNKILGLEEIETTQPFYDSVQRVHFEDRMQVEKLFSEAQKNREIYDAIHRIVRPDGSIRWIRDKGKVICDNENNAIYMTGTVIDITDHKRIEEALHEASERLRLALDAGRFGVWDWDIVRDQLTWSERLFEMYGISKNEFGGRIKDFSKYVHPDDQAHVETAIKHALDDDNGTYEIEFKIIRQDNQTARWLYMRGQVFYDLDGEPVRMLGATLDITDRKLSEQSLQEHKNELEETIDKRTRELRELSAHLQTIREEEKATIAREIHDELGGTLTALKIDLAWIGNKLSNLNSIAKEKIESMLNLVDSAIQSTRRIQSELRPTVIDDLGLIPAIKWQTNEFQKRTGIKCKLALPEHKPPLPSTMRVALFRILQETLTNIARHSHAKQVTVSLSLDEDTITLAISDDGSGIDIHQAKQPGKYGIRGILERVHHLGGEVKIEGHPTKGTSITVRVPISHTSIKRRITDTIAP